MDAVARLPGAANGTVFQRLVWDALRHIPAGHTVSYGALVVWIGRPVAAPAVGLANGANPIAIIVPCHRVIGANASLTGYGGGLDRKRWLLAHESARTDVGNGRSSSHCGECGERIGPQGRERMLAPAKTVLRILDGIESASPIMPAVR